MTRASRVPEVAFPIPRGREGKGKEGKGKEEKRTLEKEKSALKFLESSSLSLDNTLQNIFEHWKTVMRHPEAKLDHHRKTLMTKALNAGYEAEQICQAITGCSYTPHNMGDNDRGQRYDGLHIILRDADQIDRFIHHYHYPPHPISEAERRTKANVHTLQRWLQQKMTEERK